MASKRLPLKEEKKQIYCRMCQRSLREDLFYKSVDPLLDTNGKMSICSDCINLIYNSHYKNSLSFEKSIYLTCKSINVRYDEASIVSAQAHIQTFIDRGTKVRTPFGIYKTKLVQSQGRALDEQDWTEDLIFEEPSKEVLQSLAPQGKADAELMYFWGGNLDADDYAFLEREYSEYQKSNRFDTQAEKSILKLICLKTLQIRKKGNDGNTTLLKDLRELMKTGGIDPAKILAANSGKSAETFSNFIKMTEEFGPAEWYKDREKFRDIDGMEEYGRDFVRRPLKNYTTRSRDFKVTDKKFDNMVFESEEE